MSVAKDIGLASDTETIQQALLQQPRFDLFILLKILDDLGFKLSVKPKKNVA